MKPFVATETAFTKTALTLSNSNANQGVSFPTFGTPERQKINAALAGTNLFQFGGL